MWIGIRFWHNILDKKQLRLNSADLLFHQVNLPEVHELSIERPGRYIGGEWNSVRSSGKSDTSICLIFPDLYEIGVSYYGFQILYHILNRIVGVSCERAFLPWLDMQSLIQQSGTVLTSLESQKPLGQFDLLGFTLQTEMHYPGVLKILDLAGIPRLAADRDESHPLIIGGGPSAYHPEPVAVFFDVFLLGDGEEALPELIQLIQEDKYRRAGRRDQWWMISELDGFYVPGLYRPDPSDQRSIVPIDGAPPRIRGRIVTSLVSENYPINPIVPFVKGEHDRLTIEIMRGCTQGCRFCQAGMLHRPLRERPVDEIITQVMAGLEATGWDEVGLLSLSTSDYSQLETLLVRLADQLAGKKATVGFPSLRPSTFTEQIARIDTGGRKSGVTFAAESGSQRMRNVINKNITDDELFSAIDLAYRYGWSSVKIYLMVGLPTELPEDIAKGAELLRKLERMVPRKSTIHFSVAPFIPKPHSVFEGERYVDIEELWDRMRGLYQLVGRRWVKRTKHDPQRSQIEALLSRGDRRLAPVIEAIADGGDGFEGWGGHFSLERWYRALGEYLPDWKSQLETIGTDEPKPWSHLIKGITPRFMKNDLQAAYEERKIVDCRTDECYQCGLRKSCDCVGTVDQVSISVVINDNSFGGDKTCPNFDTDQSKQTDRSSEKRVRYRLTFSKLWKARFLGHHDLMSTIERGLRRASVPLIYSQGFTPRPRISYGPALPLGYGAVQLWLDFESSEQLDPQVWLKKIRTVLPSGIRPWSILPIQRGETTQQSEVRVYRLRFHKPIRDIDPASGSSSDLPQDIESWEVDSYGRTLTINLLSPSAGGARPEQAWRQLCQDNYPEAKLLSVTRL